MLVAYEEVSSSPLFSFPWCPTVLVFVLFAVINLAAGFACAVALGYGPKPWYALFLPSGGDSVVRIDALEAEDAPPAEDAEAKDEAPKAKAEPEAEESKRFRSGA